ASRSATGEWPAPLLHGGGGFGVEYCRFPFAERKGYMKPQRLAAGTLPKALVSSHSGCENQAASTRVWRTSCGRKPFPREDHIMKWSCMVASAALVCLALAPPSMAQTEKDALALVSDDALGFIVLNRLGETNDKLGALVKR